MMKTQNGLIGAALLLLGILGMPASLAAQTNSAGSTVEKFKGAIIELVREIAAVTETITTVADAEKAEPKIEKMMDKLTGVIEELGADVDAMSLEELEELGGFEAIFEDPEVTEWGEKAEAAVDVLKSKNSEAAAKLEELIRNHSETFMQAMMSVAMKIQQRTMGTEADELYQEESKEY